MLALPATSHSSGRHCLATWDVPLSRRKAYLHRSALMLNNNVPTRKRRRLGPANYLRRPQRSSLRHVLHPRKRLPKRRHLLTKPSRRTGRIANCCSSTPPSIGGPRRPTGFHVPRRPLSSRRERSSPQLLLQVSGRIFLAKSRRK